MKIIESIESINRSLELQTETYPREQNEKQKKMKFLIVFGFVAAVSAMPYHGLVNTGASAVQRHDDVRYQLLFLFLINH